MPTPEATPRKRRAVPPGPRDSSDGQSSVTDAHIPSDEEFRSTVRGWGGEAWTLVSGLSSLMQVEGMRERLSTDGPERTAAVSSLQTILDSEQTRYVLGYFDVRSVPEDVTAAPVQRRKLPRKAAPRQRKDGSQKGQ